MRSIWKYTLALIDGPQTWDLPEGFAVVHVANQGGLPAIWVDVDPHAAKARADFVVHGTGHTVQDGSIYQGTAHCARYVWHVFLLK